jgi:hypothetical protein
MKHVFISYKKEDIHFADAVKRKLESSGFASWIDRYQLAPPDRWSNEIEKALRNCIALVVIITPDMLNSDYITYEWSFALGADKPVIGVMMKAVDENLLHPELRVRQFLNYVNRSLDDDNKFIETIKTRIEMPNIPLASSTKPKEKSATHSPLFIKLKSAYELKKPVGKDFYLAVLAQLGYITREERVILNDIDQKSPSA